jgi:hypothetical protein
MIRHRCPGRALKFDSRDVFSPDTNSGNSGKAGETACRIIVVFVVKTAKAPAVTVFF